MKASVAPQAAVDDQMKSLLRFYRTYFAVELNITAAMIPELDPSKPWHSRFGMILPMPKGLTYEAACEPLKRFQRRFYHATPELLQQGLTDERDFETDYVIRVEEVQESNTMDLVGETQETIREKRIPTMTLRERIVFELLFWDRHRVGGSARKKGNDTFPHLDVEGSTRCYGSTYSNGESPVAYWFKYGDRNEFCVDRPMPDAVSWLIRPRRVITIWG